MRAFAAALLVLGISGVSRADLVAHNGTGASGGTGAVDVHLSFGNGPGAVKLQKVFSENTDHTLSYNWDDGEPAVSWKEGIINDTGIAWTSFDLTLFGADFFGSSDGQMIGGPASETDPVQTSLGFNSILYSGPSSVLSSAIGRLPGEPIDVSSLRILFDDPIQSGESFHLTFFIDISGQLKEGFRLVQGPTPIPAPGAALLAAVGLGFIRWARRRIA